MGAGGAFTDGENEFGDFGDMSFSFGAAGAVLFADGAGAELGASVLVVGSSLVVLLHPARAPAPMIATPPATNANLRLN